MRSFQLRYFFTFCLAFALIWGLHGANSLYADEPIDAAQVDLLLATPVLISPSDGATTTGLTDPPLGMPSFRWEAVPDATLYRIQISASAGFASLLVDKDTYALSFNGLEVLADGVYFWRVKAKVGTVWGPDSEIRSFEKDWSAGGTLQPLLTSPADGARRTDFADDDFAWDPVDGAAYYVLDISTDPSFSSLAYTSKTIQNRHTPVERLASNVYYWRVTPADNRDHLGTPSQVNTFTFAWDQAPELISPLANAEESFLPRFSWTAVESAKEYRLEISTQPDFGTVQAYVTRNTDYTPVENLSNDQDYYWRVQATDYKGHNTPWSVVRQFRIRWDFQAQLLTPTNNSIRLSFPFFSWTPIPGVERYQIQIDETTSFDFPIADVKIYNATTYAHPKWSTVLIDGDYFWRVRGIDAQGNLTPWSNIFSFRPSYENNATPVYPLFYYTPDAVNTPTYSDRSIAWPLFVWDSAHLYTPANPITGESWKTTPPDYYELTVDDDGTFGSPNFQIFTVGSGASPTASHPFTATQNSDKTYYWRLRAFLSGTQLGSDVIWRTRIDPAVEQLPFSPFDAAPVPIHPADGFEAVGVPPVLGWLPVTGAGSYRVQIARDAAFTELVEDVQPQFVNYVPWQGQVSAMPFGTYWWRVKAENPEGEWSEPRHFNLSVDLVTGNPYDYVPPIYPAGILSSTVAYDPSRSAVTAGNLLAAPNGIGDVHVMLDRTYTGNLVWIFGFRTNAGPTDALRYGIYLDTDHVAGSGGTTDPLGKPISVDSMYLPDYVLYVDRGAGDSFSSANTTFSSWNGSGWNPARSLAAIGGDVWFDAGMQAVQILLPYTAIESANINSVGSVAFTLFSTDLDSVTGMLDSAPPQAGSINRPAFVSDMLMPLYPFDIPESNPVIQYEMPTLRWRMPLFDSVDGYQVEVARDRQFTDIVETWETYEDSVPHNRTWAYFALLPAAFQSLNPIGDNESYFWRVRIRHERYIYYPNLWDYGPWSPPMRFKLDSRQVGNPMPSNGSQFNISPTFTWDRVEGAAGYTIQIDDDANFSSPLINEKVDGVSYTPAETLNLRAFASGSNYFWRVAMRRSGNVVGHWTAPATFVKTLPVPQLISPTVDQIVNRQPTFVWSPILTPTVTPRMAAPRYRLQYDDDPNFSSPSTVTTDGTTYSPNRTKSLVDGTWYWRVAMIDGNNVIGPYSPIQRFYKEYLPPTLISPEQGSQSVTIPMFEWSPVAGAAYYRVQFANNPLYNLSTTVSTDDTRFTPTNNLKESDYFWRVAIYDDDNKPGPYIEGRVLYSDYHIFLPLLVR